MNTQQLLGKTAADALLEQTGSRRDAIRGAGKWGMGLALASVPVFLTTFAKRAMANHTATPLDVLKFATTLEYLESEFYNIGMGTSGLIPSSDRGIFGTIQNHENAHVQFLVNALGSNAPPKPTFDFTAGGRFNPFGDYAQFLMLSQAFEDTGVRAYKGGAPVLLATPAFLNAALSIHSVEARHASEVRRLRGGFTEQEPQQGWPTGNNRGTGMPPETQPVYNAGTEAGYPAEDNTTHAGVNVATLGSGMVTNATSYSEAFDEPLDIQAVLSVANLFIVR